jgi:sugar-specific transcriptional regulator TrmB
VSLDGDRLASTHGDAASMVECLGQELQALEMSPYQARVLGALLQLGTGTSLEVAELSGIPRTSIYKVMEALGAQGLVERVPARWPASWTCIGWEAVVQRLEAAGEERARQQRVQLRRLRQLLAGVAPADSRSTSTCHG